MNSWTSRAGRLFGGASQLALALAVSVVSTSAMAQTATHQARAEPAGATMEEVVVTAQRREQNIQDVPASITAIGGGALEKRQIKSVNGLSAVAPNLQVSEVYGPGSPASF